MQYFVVQSLLDSAVWKFHIGAAWQFTSGAGTDWFKPDLLLSEKEKLYFMHII